MTTSSSGQKLQDTEEHLVREFAGRRGHFAYESGYHGNLFLNLDRVIGKPSELTKSVDKLSQQISLLRPDLVCGALTGGAFIAYAIACKLDTRFCWSSRTDRVQTKDLYPFDYHIEGDLDGLKGKRVVIVDDVISAGSAVRGTLEDLRRHGVNAIALAALLTVGPSAAELCQQEDLQLLSLAHIESEIWAPLECLLCRSGEPVIDIT